MSERVKDVTVAVAIVSLWLVTFYVLGSGLEWIKQNSKSESVTIQPNTDPAYDLGPAIKVETEAARILREIAAAAEWEAPGNRDFAAWAAFTAARESRLDPKAVSKNGEVGAMQVSPVNLRQPMEIKGFYGGHGKLQLNHGRRMMSDFVFGNNSDPIFDLDNQWEQFEIYAGVRYGWTLYQGCGGDWTRTTRAYKTGKGCK